MPLKTGRNQNAWAGMVPARGLLIFNKSLGACYYRRALHKHFPALIDGIAQARPVNARSARFPVILAAKVVESPNGLCFFNGWKPEFVLSSFEAGAGFDIDFLQNRETDPDKLEEADQYICNNIVALIWRTLA